VPTRYAGRDSETGEKIEHRWNAKVERECIKFARRGADSNEIAVLLDLRPGSVRYWYGKVIDRELALKNLAVEEAMYENAQGYKHPDTHISVNVPKGGTAIVTSVPIVKHYPPNVVSGQFILKNRSAASWKDDQAVRVPPDEGAAAIRAMLRQMTEVGG
jgi:hypothetical protein